MQTSLHSSANAPHADLQHPLLSHICVVLGTENKRSNSIWWVIISKINEWLEWDPSTYLASDQKLRVIDGERENQCCYLKRKEEKIKTFNISQMSVFIMDDLKGFLYSVVVCLQLFVSAQLLHQWFSLSLSILLFDWLININIFILKSER